MDKSRHTTSGGHRSGGIPSHITCWCFSIISLTMEHRQHQFLYRDPSPNPSSHLTRSWCSHTRKALENLLRSSKKLFHLSDNLLIKCGAINAWNNHIVTHGQFWSVVISCDQLWSVVISDHNWPWDRFIISHQIKWINRATLHQEAIGQVEFLLILPVGVFPSFPWPWNIANTNSYTEIQVQILHHTSLAHDAHTHEKHWKTSSGHPRSYFTCQTTCSSNVAR